MNFRRFFRRKGSGNIAKDRLKIVLVSDRAACSPAIVENIREDLLSVLAKYTEIDTSQIDIQIIQAEEGHRTIPALVARVPFKSSTQE